MPDADLFTPGKQIDPDYDGVYAGTTWSLDWGDGTVNTYTSSADSDIPTALGFISHVYTAASDCVYEVTLTVENPCGEISVVTYPVDVHGRDQGDNDGQLIIEDVATGETSVIEVCEGTQHSIVLRDISDWNCQDPVFPDGTPAPPNDKPRTIQWVYGEDDGGTVQNTIGTILGTLAPVIIGGANNATVLNGYEQLPVIGPITATGELSQTILIPADCRAGEIFDVYLRNWNKCNPYPADPPVYTHIRILVVDAPPAPAIDDPTICFGESTLLDPSSTPEGEFYWYDAGMNFITTGDTYDPGVTAPGVYTYYVTDQQLGGNLCESPPTEITLTINPIPDQPTISRNNPDFCYDGTSSIILTANPHSPPPVTGYRWYRNGSLLGGETSNTITLSSVGQSGTYTVMSLGIAPTYCESPLSDPLTVVIGEPATVNAGPATATICSNSTYSTNGSFGGGASSASWSSSGDGIFANVNDLTTTYTPGTNDISSGTATLRLTTNDPNGPCPSVFDNIILTIVRAPSANAGADAAICQSETYTVNDATASNYNTINWTRTGGTGTITNGNTLTPTYTPSAGDAGLTVTLRLTATGNSPCANTSDTKLLYIDRTPVATTGPAQEICGDVNAVAVLQGNTGGTDLNNGATGLWSFPNIWKEDFTGLANGTTSDAGPTAWTRTTSNTSGAWYSEVRSQRYELRANRTIWTSGNINISSYASAGVSVDLSSMTTSGFETADYVNIRCIINGTPQAPFWSSTGAVDGTTGGGSRAFRTRTAYISGITGNNLQIRIEARSSHTDEYYYFDNITVTEGNTPVITDPSNPTSTVTNLPSGPTTFTWTVSSAHGGCTPATATHTITRWDPPTTANAGPDDDVCENVTTYTLAGNTPSVGTGQWSTTGSAVITNPGSPTSGVTNLAAGNNDFTWTISNGNCTPSTDVVTIFRNSPVSPGTISADQQICQGETPAPLTGTNASGGDGINYTYSWQYSEASSGGPWIPIAGTNTTGYSPGPLTTSTWYRRLVSGGDAGCLTQQNVPSNVIEIFVEPELLPGSISGDQSICLGDSPAAFASVAPASGGNSPAYLWYHRLDAGAWGPIAGAVNATYTAPNTLVEGTHYYYREAISSTGYCDPVQTNQVYIIVNPGPATDIHSISGDASKCENQTITLNYAIVTDATEYVWNFSWIGGHVDATTATPDITIDLSVYTFTSPFQDVTITAAGVNGCNIDPAPVTGDYPWSAPHNLRVYRNPVADAGSDNSVCASLSITLAATASVGTGTWTDLGTGPGTVSFNNANLPGAVATATHYGTYALQWSENNGGCTDFDNVTVSFYEQPSVTAPDDAGLCGTLTTTLTATGHSYQAGSSFSPVFLWEYVSGPDNTPSFGSSNAVSTTVTVDYYGVYRFRITETNGTCSHSDVTEVIFSEDPINASAGTNINVTCDLLSVNLNGTAHTYLGGSNQNTGTRTWSYVSGPDNTPSFSNPADPHTQVSVDEFGNYIFRWTETNGACTVSDDVEVKFYENPDNITGSGPYEADCDAKDIDISVTAHTYSGVAATHPESTRGWSYFSGPDNTPVFSAPTSPNTNVTVDYYGTYTFRWTETNGPCSNYVDVTVTYYENPDGASAGLNVTAACNSKSINLAGTAHNYEIPPSTHTGSIRGWSYVSGPDNTPSFTSPTSPTSEVIVDYFGSYEFEWTETNGNCTVSDRVTVTFYERPDGASAGTAPVPVCDALTVTLAGTEHTYDPLPDINAGTQSWSVVNKPHATSTVTFGNSSDPASTVTVNHYGTYTLRWTETNGNCTVSSDITFTFHEMPDGASAGAPPSPACGALTTTLAGTEHSYTPSPNVNAGTQSWSVISKPDITSTVTFININSPTSGITVNHYGTYTLRWTEINGNCEFSPPDITFAFYEAPAVSVTPVADVCRDHSLVVIPVSGTFGGGASSASWSIVTGGGSLQNINIAGNTVSADYLPVYSDVTTGSITLRLATDDPAGPCTPASADLTINIDEAVYVVIDQAPQILIAEGTSAVITATVSGANGMVTTGTWTEEGALTGGTFTPDNLSNNITFTPTAAQEAVGSVVLRLTSADPGTSCGPVFAEITIIIGENPVADAGPDIEDCEPADGLLHLSGYAKASANDADWSVVTGAGTIISQTKTWSVPEATPHDENDSLLVEAVYQLAPADYGTPSSSSSFQFRLTTDDPDGGGPVSYDSDDMTYTVNWAPHTPPIGGGGKDNMCVNSFGNYYSVPLTPGNTYTWEIDVLSGGGVAGTDYVVQIGGTGYNYMVIDWINVGTYNLKVTETTYLSDGVTPCTGATVVKAIGVYSQPVVSAGPGAVICIGDTYTLSGSVTGGSGSFIYEWSPAVGLSSFTIPDPVVTGTFIGDVVYTLKATDLVSGCASASGTVTITTNPLPNIYTLTGNTFYCYGAATGVTLTLSDSETDVLYQLVNGAAPVGSPVPGTGNPITWADNFDGSYFVQAVRNAVPACSGTMAGVVNVIANPEITITVNQVVNTNCFGSNEGRISITPSGGTAPYTYLWSGPGLFSSTNEDITGLFAGDYIVITTDSRGCQYVSDPITVSEPAELKISSLLETKAVTCFGGSDGEAEVTVDVSTGTAPYSYQWYYDASFSSPVTGAQSFILSGIPAATYYILVTDASMCTVNGSVTITQPTLITGSGAVTTPVSCNGESDAVITVTASGGSGTLEYDLNNSGIWQASNIFSGLGSGNYTLRVRDAFATICIVNLPDVVITEPAVLSVSLAGQTNVLCFGDASGSINVSVSGGTSAYTYSWTGTDYLGNIYSGLNEDPSGLLAGDYDLIVTDANGCTTSLATVTITQPDELAVSFDDQTNVLCYGGNTGAVNVTVTGGVTAYTFTWTGVNYLGGVYTGFSEDPSGLRAGTYNLTVRDANGCSVILPPVTITQPPDLILTLDGKTNVLCHDAATGAIDISVTGGAVPYGYSWTGTDYLGNIFNSTEGDLAGLKAGTYSLVVTDNNNCTVTMPAVNITQPADLTITLNATTDVLCYDAATGAVYITVDGGVQPVGGYTFNWTGLDYLNNAFSSSSEDLSGIKAGTYNLTVTDENGCSETLPGVIINQPPELTVTLDDQTNVLCYNAATGAINVTVAGGVMPAGGYIYTWIGSDYLGTYFTSSSEDLTGLKAGTYNLTVRDNNGCIVTLPAVTITQSTQFIVTKDSHTNVLCHDATTGEIEVSVTGGVTPYVYSWTGTNYLGVPFSSTDEDLSGLKAGTYLLTVTDDNGCSAILPVVTITQPADLTVTLLSVNNVFCHDAATGAINVSVSGGVIPPGGYTFDWTGTDYLGNAYSSTVEDPSGLRAGDYDLTVTDANLCTVALATVTITQPPDLVVALDGQTNVLCHDAASGAINVTVAGGVMPAGGYYYTWTGTNYLGGAFVSNEEDLSGLKAGTYNLSVRDANGCTVILPAVTITQPADLTVVLDGQTNLLCYDDSGGTINVTVAGGVEPSGGYIYSWTGTDYLGTPFSSSDEDLTNLKAGTYNLSVVDENNCTVILPPVTITQPSDLVVSVTSQTNVLCFGDATGAINVTVSGGTIPSAGYLFAWTGTDYLGNPYSSSVEDPSGLLAGIYNLTVTDENGCNASILPVTITSPPALSLTVNVTSDYNGEDISCNSASDGRVEAVAGGGTGVYFYTWYSDPAFSVPIGQFTPIAINLAAGDYYIRVRDMNGCIIEGSVTLYEPDALDAAIISQINVSCFNNATGSVTVEALAGSGTAPYQYSINGGSTWQNDGIFSNLPAAIYTIIVRDVNGCFKLVPVTITQPTQLTASITGITNVSCNGGSDGTVTVTATAGSGVAPYEYSINGGTDWAPAGTFTGLAAGPYNVIVRDANGCTLTVPVIITEPNLLQITKTPDILLDCFEDKDGTGTFYASGGTLNYTFTRELNTADATFAAPGFNSYSFFNAGEGVVSVRVTDSKGCYEIATITFTQPPVLEPGMIGPDLQIICKDVIPAELTQLTPATGGPGTISYQWQYANNIAGPFFNIADAISDNYAPPDGATSTLFYRRSAASGICPPVYSNIVEVRVNPLPIAILSGDATICPGESAILEVDLAAGTGPYEIDIIDDLGVITGYTSGDVIEVSPAVTTTYTLYRVEDANGCIISGASPNLIGSATVAVRALPVITDDPDNVEVCEYGMAGFTVVATPLDISYQWYVDKNDGTGITALEDVGVYFGAHAATLHLYGVTRDMDGYIYNVVVSGCSPDAVSASATLTVNTVPEIITQPKDTVICSGDDAAFHVSAEGTGLTFRWQVRKGTGSFVDVESNLTNYSGAADSILLLTDIPENFNNYLFRVIVDGDCGVPLYSNVVVLRVNKPPTVTIQPVDRGVCDGAGSVYFRAGGSGMIDSLRWQVFLPSATDWTDIYDDAIYSGTTTQQLSLIDAPLSYNGNQYRLALKAFCEYVFSNPATLTVHTNPVVTFDPDPVPACGGVEKLMAPIITGGSGTWTRHNWTGDIGPLNNYFIQNPTFRTMMPGTYNLDYRVEDNNGCYGNGSVVVEVDSPDASFNLDQSIMCTPDTVKFTKDDWTGIVSWTWDFGDGITNNTETDPEHIFTNTNLTAIEYYNVRLTVISTGGCTAYSTQLVTVFPAVDAAFDADKLFVCSGDLITFSAKPGAANYYWDYGDGVSSPGTYIQQYLYTNTTDAPVVRTVTLITYSIYNCTDIKTLDITVMPVPAPQFSAAPTPQIFNPAGNTMVFTNETPFRSSFTYTWTFGDGGTSADVNPSHIFTGLGTYDVTLEATNGTCTESITHQVSILPEPPVAGFDPIPSGCAPLYVNINNTSLNVDMPGTTYRWDFGDGSISTAKNPTYTYFTPGDYRIELVVTGPGGTSMATQVVSAWPSPKAYFEVTPPTVYVNDERVRCFNLSEGATSYLWDFGDGDTSKVKEPYHRYMEEGEYDITLWAYSANGCTDMYVLSPAVTVLPVGEIRFASVFTPNKTGPVERTDLPTGGVEVDQFFYPPIRQTVLNYKLQIFNRLGVLIFESHDINVPWNGYYKGDLCQQGVYVWYVEGKFADGKPFKMVGNVTLLQ